MSGANGCQGASWSKEFDGKELRGAACDLAPRRSPFSGHRLHGQPILLHLLQVRCLRVLWLSV